MKRTTLPPRTAPLKRKRKTARRVSVLRDRGYLDWLRDCECVIRIGGPSLHMSDPAHGPVNGRGSKGPDNEAIPLCRNHHEEQHRLGWPAFEKKYGFSREREAAAHWAAYSLTTASQATTVS